MNLLSGLLLGSFVNVGESQRFAVTRSLSNASIIFLTLLVVGGLLLMFKRRR